jgi:demethylmenaquinone methyltransferase/2-methoxy-6-polyprenyl-1,4-benzoquinol methylase
MDVVTRPGATDALPDQADKPRAVEAMFDRIAPRYDALNRVLTFRMDVHWRDVTVDSLRLAPGARVLDIACGTGDLCRVINDAGYTAIGVDFSAGMLRAARTDAPLVRADALRLPFPDASVDGITCGFGLRNFAQPEPFFAECARVLRPGGALAVLEVAEPDNALIRTGHGMWFRHVVPFVGGLFSDRDAYRYLPESTAYLPPVNEMRAMCAAVGIVNVDHRTFFFGTAQLLTGRRS